MTLRGSRSKGTQLCFNIKAHFFKKEGDIAEARTSVRILNLTAKHRRLLYT